MSTLQEQISQLEEAIAAQESVRAVLGDTTVDSVIAALRQAVRLTRMSRVGRSDAVSIASPLRPATDP
jgi:hypothetical protein